MLKTFLALAAICALGAVLLAPAVGASKSDHRVQMGLKIKGVFASGSGPTKLTFLGSLRVRSHGSKAHDYARCRKNRRVFVYKRARGKAKRFATGHTGGGQSRYEWTAKKFTGNSAAKYFAKVTKVKRGDAQCQAARSAAVPYGS